MKRFGMLCVGTLVALGLTATAQAQVEVKVRPVQPILIGGAALLTPEAVEKLKFTAEQKDKYGKIETGFKDAMKANQEKFRADIMNLNDRTKYKEIAEKLQADNKKAREDALGKVEPILTAEQKTVFTQVKIQQPNPGGIRPLPIGGGGGGIGQVLPAGVQQRLQLTDDQKKQIEAIQKKVEADVMKVLTDEQKKQLEQMKKGGIRIQPIQPNPAPQVQPLRRNLQPANPAPRRDNE